MWAALALQNRWWRPRLTFLTAFLAPLGQLVGAEARRRRTAHESGRQKAQPLPVPVIVVGNVIVGGAGKTPTVIALIELLRRWGYYPGIISRGHGRTPASVAVLDTTSAPTAQASNFGDEPLLMHHRTGAPVAVARYRREAALHLLRAHPEVDVLIADDGLQHFALARDIELIVFDDRGLGNGHPLPAGPLREHISGLWPVRNSHLTRFALINGHWPKPPALPSPIPPECCWIAERTLTGAVELRAWTRGKRPDPGSLAALRGRPLLAVAGIGHPERFFTMLEAHGLNITRRPLPDHADFTSLPWKETEPEVVLTEKDAVKLGERVPASQRIWVVTLDFSLPDGLAHALHQALAAVRPSTNLPRSF